MCVCCFWATLTENGIFLEDDGVEEEVEEAATTLHCWWTSSTLTSRLSPSHLSLKKKWKKIKKKVGKKNNHFTTHRKPNESSFQHWRWYVGAYIVVLTAVVLVLHAHATPRFPSHHLPLLARPKNEEGGQKLWCLRLFLVFCAHFNFEISFLTLNVFFFLAFENYNRKKNKPWRRFNS